MELNGRITLLSFAHANLWALVVTLQFEIQSLNVPGVEFNWRLFRRISAGQYQYNHQPTTGITKLELDVPRTMDALEYQISARIL